jgi:hypothetical protein
MDIAKQVQDDIEARAELGQNKYGNRLTTGSRENSKTPLRNAYEEVLDLAMYIRQYLAEENL